MPLTLPEKLTKRNRRTGGTVGPNAGGDEVTRYHEIYLDVFFMVGVIFFRKKMKWDPF